MCVFPAKKIWDFASIFPDPVRLGIQIANVKQRQILPRVGNQIWVSTPQNRTIGVNLGISCSRRLGRTALRRQMLVVQTPLKSNRLSYTLKNTVKPNFIPSELRHFRTKELGFTRFLLDVACMEKTSFFYDFYGFGGVRSTQPTMPRSI